jgi:hypothetical protein
LAVLADLRPPHLPATQWVIGAVVFVLFYIGVHTGSLFITAIGTLNILMSLPVAFVPYRYIGQVLLLLFLCARTWPAPSSSLSH